MASIATVLITYFILVSVLRGSLGRSVKKPESEKCKHRHEKGGNKTKRSIEFGRVLATLSTHTGNAARYTSYHAECSDESFVSWTSEDESVNLESSSYGDLSSPIIQEHGKYHVTTQITYKCGRTDVTEENIGVSVVTIPERSRCATENVKKHLSSFGYKYGDVSIAVSGIIDLKAGEMLAVQIQTKCDIASEYHKTYLHYYQVA